MTLVKHLDGVFKLMIRLCIVVSSCGDFIEVDGIFVEV